MNKFEKVITILVVTLLVVFLGCSAVQDSIFPCYVPPESVDYAGANVPLLAPWTTIVDAEYVKGRMAYTNALEQLKYSYLREDLVTHLTRANEIKSVVFSPESPLALLIPTIGGVALGTYGLSKPSDKKKIVELEKANGGKINET